MIIDPAAGMPQLIAYERRKVAENARAVYEGKRPRTVSARGQQNAFGPLPS